MELNTHMVLRRMREVITTRGWMSGGSFDACESGPVCILGAAAVALNLRRWDEVPEWHPAVKALKFDSSSEAYAWNDNLVEFEFGRDQEAENKRGQDTVLARIDKAIEATTIKEPDEELTPYKVTPLEEPTPEKAPAPPEPEPLVPDKEPLVPA